MNSGEDILRKLKVFIIKEINAEKGHLEYLQKIEGRTMGAQCLAMGRMDANQHILEHIYELERE